MRQPTRLPNLSAVEVEDALLQQRRVLLSTHHGDEVHAALLCSTLRLQERCMLPHPTHRGDVHDHPPNSAPILCSFPHQAGKLDALIEQNRVNAEKQRVELEQRISKQQLAALQGTLTMRSLLARNTQAKTQIEPPPSFASSIKVHAEWRCPSSNPLILASHQEQSQNLARDQAAELAAAEAQWREELALVSASQTKEVKDLSFASRGWQLMMRESFPRSC